MDRLTRGFHRIGLVGAVPLILAGLVFLAVALSSGSLQGSNGEGGMTLLCGALAVLWYVICRALAWIINGFRETA
ncbi:hypothetical protein DWF00_16580 [Bosea caraganae]|uniref:Uncharacterized protein n=1 Tax=Bosea caraganae TaxID=2763117 RepID=A0A370KYS2_9HYPH|nr:hypothetical protein [Bosea caraganae]RDJ20125.1 hypothetical protein DWE98_26185 [Bosea caraganae]RDJ24837.1 hypothetical protein DWF00_16580 [Bosea caraganae]